MVFVLDLEVFCLLGRKIKNGSGSSRGIPAHCLSVCVVLDFRVAKIKKTGFFSFTDVLYMLLEISYMMLEA